MVRRAHVCWIALNNAGLKPQTAGDLQIGRECHSLAELEQDVAQIKSDLEEIVQEAKARFQTISIPPETDAIKRFLRNLPDKSERE